jgi:hypothetical protein
MSSKPEPSTGDCIQLTTTNRDEWYIDLKSHVIPMGTIHASILNNRKLPTSELPVPHINEYHVDEYGCEIKTAPKYKSVVKDNQGNPLKTATGDPIYESTMPHYEALEKARSVRRLDTIRIDKIVASVAMLIMKSIPERSRNLLSTIDQTRYESAQSNPAELLDMIDETHQPKDDASLINSLTEFLECRQDQYSGDFLGFIANHSRLQRKLSVKLNPKQSPETKEALEAIFKSILLINCDHQSFNYLIDGMKSGELDLTYIKLVDKMTTFVQNTSVSINERQLIASGKKPGKGKSKPLVRKPDAEIAAVAIGAIDSTCHTCGKNMPSAIDARTGLPFDNCRTCNLKKNQVPARFKEDPTSRENKPNLSRAQLQNDYNKSLARLNKKEKERESQIAAAMSSGSRPKNAKAINPPMNNQSSSIERELERSAQKKALIMSILDTDESEGEE